MRFVIIESKSFDLRVVGSKDDILKISEQGRGGVGASQFFCLTQLLSGCCEHGGDLDYLSLLLGVTK